MHRRILSAMLALSGTIPSLTAAEAPVAGRAAWFTEARLGGFIHWSAGGVFGARWFGEPLRNPTPYGEWARHRNRVPKADYDAAISHMAVTPEQVDAWVKTFKDAGCGYVIFVAKHHDGLAYWPSKVSGYTFQNLSKCPTDVCAEMRKACDRHGLKLAFYYSHWQDWEHPDGWGNFWDNPAKPTPEEWKGWYDAQYSGSSVTPGLTPERFARYWDQKCVPQVVELLENYHPDVLWFDCYVPREKTIMSEAQVTGLLRTIREKAPACLVNSRIGMTEIGGENGADFETLGDNEFGSSPLPHPWETAATLNRSWGYNRDDDQWKSAGFFLRAAAHNISLGGNLAINIGPKPDGSLPPDTLSRMADLGRVVPAQIAAFRGCGPSPLDPKSQDWGIATARGNRLYLHVLEWPVDGIVRVTGLTSNVAAARLLATGAPIPFQQKDATLHLTGPAASPMPWDTVIELDLDGPAQSKPGLTGEINGGGWHLGPATATLDGLKAHPGDKFWLPAHLSGFERDSPPATATWSVSFPAAGEYPLNVCLACPDAETDGRLVLALDGIPVASGVPIRATAPDATEFRTFTLPPLKITSPGTHVLTVRSAKAASKNLRIAWLHIAPQS